MQGTISMHSTSNLASTSRCKPVIVHLDVPIVMPRIQSQPSQRCSCSVQASAGRPWQARNRNRTIAKASVPSFMSLPSVEGYIEVLALKGIRVVLENEVPTVQYLVEWKDGSEPTWEKAGDLSPDLIRDYEEKWWSAVKKAEFDVMTDMLAGGKDVLAHAVDENRRSALHFAAALGKENTVKLLLEAGADPNLQDTQGYTPLHMAAGYMHTTTMSVLLAGGSDPQLRDSTGKDVVSLLEGLRTNMPLNLGTVMQRLRLEDVANALTDLLYDEVEALAIIDERRLSDGTRELLVSWADGREDSWVAERDVSASLLQDWQEGMESARAQAITDMVQVGTERRFKIKWADNYPDSWEPEEHVSPSLIELFKQQNPRLFEERVAAAGAILPNTSGRGGLSAQASSTSSLADATPEEAAVPLMLDNLAMQQNMETQQQQQQEADGRVLATSA